ncbi:MAG: DMT family transporter, partial [Bacteroidales bacterium]|nr:DMT family transporter [Bacteroidales bacterium]
IATLGMANVYVFSKAALLEVNFFQFQFYWFSFAIIWILTYLIITGIIKQIKHLKKVSFRNLGIIGFLELCASLTLFTAIRLAENPANVSFLSNVTPVFVTIMGIRFLKERFNFIEAVGIILTIGGVILITYTRNSSISDFFGQGSGWILLSSLFLSISIIFTKINIKNIHPGIFALNRTLFLLIFGIAAMLIRQESLTVPGRAVFNMALGSFLGPFITALAQYSALKFIEASRTMIIQSTRGMFVMIGSVIYLSIIPTNLQIIGGSITIIGVIIMTWGKILTKKAGFK